MVAPAREPAPAELQQFVAQRCQAIFHQAQPPTRLTLKRHQSVWLAHCQFEHEQHTLVLKWSRHWSSLGGGLSSLVYVQEQVRRDPQLTEATIAFYDYDEARGLLLMEQAHGQSLQALMQQSLRGGQAAPARVDAALVRVGAILAHLHRLEPATMGIMHPRKAKQGLAANLIQTWRDRALCRWLPPHLRDPESYCGRFAPSFWDDDGRALLAVDLQPKNVLVCGSERVRVIDVDYSVGHAARGLAMFLVCLDRMQVRDPRRRMRQAVAGWKAAVLHGYLEARDDPNFEQELAFFYPWAVLGYYRQHVQMRPWFKPYLGWAYARLLQQVMAEHPLPARRWAAAARVPADPGAAGRLPRRLPQHRL